MWVVNPNVAAWIPVISCPHVFMLATEPSIDALQQPTALNT